MPNGPSNHYRKVYRDRRSEAPSYWEGFALHAKRLVPMGHTRPACGDYFCNRAQITLALAEVRLRIENRADDADSFSLGGKMNHFKRLLVGAIACAGMVGSVQAQAPDLGTLSPTPVVQTGFFTSASSFADIFNFSIGADHHGFFASAVGLATNGTPTIGTIDNLTLTLFAGSNATGPIEGSVTSANGSLIDMSGALVQGNYSVGISGLLHDATLGGGYRLAVSANPEPAEWMMLLAGLVVVAFMVRRRTSLVAGG